MLLLQAIICDSTIENWLLNVEKAIKTVLNGQLVGVLDGSEEVNGQSLIFLNGNEKTWMLENAAEVVLLAVHINLNSNMEKCLKESGENRKNSMKSLVEKITMAITSTSRTLKGIRTEVQEVTTAKECEDKGSTRKSSQSTRVATSRASAREETQSLYSVEGSLKSKTLPYDCNPSGEKNGNTKTKHLPSQVQKIINLIALLIHKKDFIHSLLDKLRAGDSSLTESFEWSSRVNYEYSKEDSVLSVKILDASFPYGLEYQGACPRLVLTPLTDKCFVSLAQAVKSYTVGMCVGPSVSTSKHIDVLSKIRLQLFFIISPSVQLDVLQVIINVRCLQPVVLGDVGLFSYLEPSIISSVFPLLKSSGDVLFSDIFPACLSTVPAFYLQHQVLPQLPVLHLSSSQTATL